MEYVFTKQNFETEVLQSDIPVVVDFYADWCGPCKMMAPVFEEFAKETEGRIKVGKLNIDSDVEIAQKYRIMSVPSFVVFRNGEKAGMLVGAMSFKELKENVEQVLK